LEGSAALAKARADNFSHIAIAAAAVLEQPGVAPPWTARSGSKLQISPCKPADLHQVIASVAAVLLQVEHCARLLDPAACCCQASGGAAAAVLALICAVLCMHAGGYGGDEGGGYGGGGGGYRGGRGGGGEQQ
jgi:uncharacterized membrane protein YgcG